MRRNQGVRVVLGYLCLCSLVLVVAARSHGERVLFDDFDGSPRIEPEKWYGSESKSAHFLTEAARFVAGGKLHLSAVAYGDRGSERGRRPAALDWGLRQGERRL